MKTVLEILVIGLLLCGCDNNDNAEKLVAQVVIDGELITAAYNFQGVESFANSFSKELKLRLIKSDNVDYNGFSKKWSFEYSSLEIDYYFHSTCTAVGLDSNSTLKKVGAAFISHEWMNSNKALSIAENNGGKEFRARNNAYQISASLGQALVPDAKTYWRIKYISLTDNSDKLEVNINSATGELL